jgi:hypothetical protein
LRWLELVGVHDYLALVVVVLQEARVLQQTLALERPFTQDELTSVARKLNELMDGRTAAQMRGHSLELTPVETSVVDAAASLLEGVEDAGVEPSFLEGLRDLLGQPEFTQGQYTGILELMKNAILGGPSRFRPKPALRSRSQRRRQRRRDEAGATPPTHRSGRPERHPERGWPDGMHYPHGLDGAVHVLLMEELLGSIR